MASNATKGAASGFMVAGPWGALAGGVIGGVSGLMSGGAADDAEKLGEMQAKFTRMETAENLRRMRLSAEDVLGGARASVAASNIQLSGSSKRYINNLSAQQSADQAWVSMSGRMSEEMAKEGGQVASSGVMSSMYAQQIGQLGSAAVGYYGGGETAGYGMDQAGIDMGFDQPQYNFGE
jgi:hypothetical protein